ncbi:hypothetical protein DOY81_009390 [Sarcophaga bullata]|nr:hypothetical protein DOY81_009390 [Sarcophaga bullata]
MESGSQCLEHGHIDNVFNTHHTGFTCYFFFMATFLWLSVLCYDIWLNFKDMNTDMSAKKNKKLFIMYSLYAWLGASIATIISFIIQKAKRIDDIYKPGIGINYCWLNTEQWSAANISMDRI